MAAIRGGVMTGAITNIATTITITTTADAITDVGDGCSRPRLLGHQQRSGEIYARFAPRHVTLASYGEVFLETPDWPRSCG